MDRIYSSRDFYDRQWEQRHFQDLLSRGQNILISAPRRVGKTELAYMLLDWAHSQGWRTAYGDVQDAKDEADFLNELAKMLTKVGASKGAVNTLMEAGTALRRLLPGLKYTAEGQSVELKFNPEVEDALSEVERCFDLLITSLTEKAEKFMLCLDEMPIFLSKLCKETNGEARAAHILHWFRKLRNAPNLRHVRWLLCGSIGLDTFVEQRGLAGTINDLKPEKLGPFEGPIAIEFVKLRARLGVEAFAMPDDVAAEVVGRVGWALPFYLKLMVDEMQAIPPRQRSKNFPSSADVEAAFAVLVSSDKQVQFRHWVSRLELQFGIAVTQRVHVILKACCQKPAGMSKSRLRQLMIKRQPEGDVETLERELVLLLSILQRDGYLHSEDGTRWVFRSFLLRDFWKNHVVY
ncbi:AAA-like domain-containing protein [Prosthecobacter sp.]|uniref:AAA-like domain-containing protein n=1 Tax=Prosthecobacter sp. TaxID=1965333 RepID=UPI00378325C2